MAETQARQNQHLSDPLLQPFLASSFSPIGYLNSHLPHYNRKSSLSSLSTESQSHISTISAHTARLSATLTALTDEILRCSSRLAYEVEILREETTELVETLGRRAGPLGEAFTLFAPKDLGEQGGPAPDTSKIGNVVVVEREQDVELSAQGPPGSGTNVSGETVASTALSQLEELHRVRASLLDLKNLFSRALAWPLPPSLVNSSSSSGGSFLVSIQPPSTPETERLEQEGQAALRGLRSEVSQLITMGDVGGARRRVQELQQLTGIWKGTKEEKARKVVIDELQAMIKD